MVRWLKRLLSGQPHFIIGGAGNPYMLRWYLIPRNPLLNVYLHKFLRDDDDRALHDHPWWFLSIMLRGQYLELLDDYDMQHRRAPSIALRRAHHRHRVVLNRDILGRPEPCWTLVITGPKVREWGFWCPHGFRVWHEFVAPQDSGDIGRGCE